MNHGKSPAAAGDVLLTWLEQSATEQTALAGGKGSSLARMTAAGLPVPPGFVICASAFQSFLASTPSLGFLRNGISSLNVNDEQALAAVSQKISESILASPIPEELEQQIRGAYERLSAGGADAFVAVRSSAVAEDSEAASFAGQHQTLLNIRGADAVLQGVRECWASFFAPQALFYRAQKGALEDTGMAVVVQRMVQAEKSGVMFTMDPIHKRRDHMVIEAVFGLGEGIVSGLITPDHHVIDRARGSLVNEFIAVKPVAVLWDAEKQQNTERELDEEAGSRRVLSDADLKNLHELGLRLEAYFGKPQDVEWSICGGNLLLLQSRPITTF